MATSESDNNEQSDTSKLVSCQLADLLYITELPSHMMTVRDAQDNTGHARLRCGMYGMFEMVGFNLSEILTSGVIEALDNKRIDVLQLISDIAIELSIEPDDVARTRIINILASFDDVEYYKKICEIRKTSTDMPFLHLLAMCKSNSEHIVRHLARLTLADPCTQMAFKALNTSAEHPLEVAMLIAVAQGHLKTIKTLLSEYAVAPTIRQLNLYMSTACESFNGEVNYFRKLGATMCACGDTHDY